jgi:ribosomal protein S12 methylthiotransferase
MIFLWPFGGYFFILAIATTGYLRSKIINMAKGGKAETYYVATLGCPKNEIDSESLEMDLRSVGLERAENPEEADLILVNSCGFIGDAKTETIQTTLELHQSRKKNSVLVMCGCLPARYNLTGALDEVDLYIPWNKHRELVSRLREMGWSFPNPEGKIVMHPQRTPPILPYAYLRISEGCDNRCAYCAIPDIKGPFVSRAMHEITDEALYLCENGVRELVVIGQDTTLYGRNGDSDSALHLLLKELSETAGCDWIRLMYAHPAHLSDETISMMSLKSNIVKYIDLPLQHINDQILKRMNRKVTRRQIETLIMKLRRQMPEIVLRTTFIVGFPGETDQQFEELLDFCEETGFDNIGVFKYSPEEGTPAYNLGERVIDEIIEERYLTLLDIQNMISAGKLSKRVNTREQALLQEIGPDGTGLGRGWFQAPEVDGQMIIADCHGKPGDLVDVIIERSDAYDLFARESGKEESSCP